MTFSLRLRRALLRCSVLLTARTSSKPTANFRWPPVLRAVHARCGVPLTGPVFAWLPAGSMHGVGRPRDRRSGVIQIGHIGQDFPMSTVFTR